MDARGFKRDLSVEIFSAITASLNAMNSCLEYIIVCFVDFININYLVEGVSSQLGKVHYEVGVITKGNEQSLTLGAFAYAVVTLFVSKASTFEAIDKAPGEKVYISTSTSASAGGDTIDKNYINNLIEGFSPQENYVLDLFSGGIVLQQSLMSRRRCIALCKDDLEAMNLETKCSQILEENQQLCEWCGHQTSSQNQKIDLDDAQIDALNNMEVDLQPSGDDEDEEEDHSKNDSTSSDEEDEVITNKPTYSGVDKENEDKENDKQNKDSSSSSDKEEEVNMDKPESSGVEKKNEDMESTEENQHNDAEQCNLDKHKDNNEEDTTHLHKSLNRDIDDSSEIGRL